MSVGLRRVCSDEPEELGGPPGLGRRYVFGREESPLPDAAGRKLVKDAQQQALIRNALFQRALLDRLEVGFVAVEHAGGPGSATDHIWKFTVTVR